MTKAAPHETSRIEKPPVETSAGRGSPGRQAARFKKTLREVEAKERAEEVVGKVRALAEKHKASPKVVEEVYRVMVSRFISLERRACPGSRVT